MTAQTAAPAVGTAAPVAPAPPARVAAALAVVVALVGGLMGPGGQLDTLLGANAVTVAAGRVEAQVAEGWIPVPVGSRVQPGATLRAPDGQATLRVPGGSVDLAEGTRLTTEASMRVQAGTVVVHGSRTVVGDGSTHVQGTDTWRYDAAGRIGAYTGSVVVTDAADREVLVRSLQEARVRDGILAAEPRPYVYAGADAFDRQFLATAFDVDDYLAALRTGLQAQYGNAPQGAAFYTDFDGLDGSLVGVLGDIGFEREGDRVGPPAEVLVASVVTEALVVDAGLVPDVASQRVRDLRVAGATWGLVVQGHDLDASHVRAAADRALARRQLAEQQGTAAPVIQSQTPDGASPGTTSGGSETPRGSTPPATDGQEEVPDDDGGDAVPPSSDDPDDGSGPVRDAVDDTGADDLLDDDAGNLVDDVVESVDDAVQDVEEGTGQLVDAVDPTSPSESTSGVVGETVSEVGDEAAGAVDDVTDAVDGATDAVESGVGSLLGD